MSQERCRRTPYELDGHVWAACDVNVHALRLGVPEEVARQHLACPEFVVLTTDNSGLPETLVRLAYTANTPAGERVSLLKDIFRNALLRWRRDEEDFREKMTAKYPAAASSRGGGLSHAESLARIKAAYQEAVTSLENDPATWRNLEVLDCTWRANAPFVMRMVVDEWWNFLALATSPNSTKGLYQGLPADIQRYPNLALMASVPLLGLVLAVQGFYRFEERFSKAFIPGQQVKMRFRRLMERLDQESDMLNAMHETIGHVSPAHSKSDKRTRRN